MSTDKFRLRTFLEGLSERTRHFCVFPSYDLQTASLFCNEKNNITNAKLRMIALIDSETIVALFNLSLTLRDDESERFRIDHKIDLNDNDDARLAPCISDQYQNQSLGSYLMEKTLNIARQLGKHRVILSGGVLIENPRAIRFFEKNKFQLLEKVFLSHDGYQCRDGFIEI